MIKTTSYLCKIVFTTPVLGSQPTKNVASEFLAKKAGMEVIPDDELESLPEVLERGTTVFHRNKHGIPCFYDYQVKGFIKESGRLFNGMDGVKALRSKVENYLFIEPRVIKLNMPHNGEMDYLERPLRAETAQGPRVTLARSEQLPEGTWFEIYIDILKPGPITETMLRELLEYGSRKGIGQWRNGGFGRFTFTLKRIKDEDEVEEVNREDAKDAIEEGLRLEVEELV